MTFTLGDLGGIALVIIGAVLTLLNIIDKTIALKAKSEEPEKTQDARITTLEVEMRDVKQYLDNDKRSITELRACNNMSMRALFAILSHLVSGNDITRLKSTQSEMQDFLTNRGIDV